MCSRRRLTGHVYSCFEGDAGIGKTTVWWETIRRAQAMGFGVLSCRVAEYEMTMALAAVADLLEAISDVELEALPPIQRRALDVAMLRAGADGEPLEPRRVAASLKSVLAAMSDKQPLLIAIDDEQWLDRASATMIGFALRRLDNVHIAWMLAHRSGHPMQLDVARLARPEQHTRLTLGPLSLAALHDVISPTLSGPIPRPMMLRIHKSSGGNPLHAIEIAREIEANGGTLGVNDDIPIPDTLKALIDDHIRRLPVITQEALAVCAALSSPSLEMVDEESLDPAVEAGIVTIDSARVITFRHPLYAAAVYQAMPRRQRIALHSRLADLATEPEERARHLALAASPGEAVARALIDGAVAARTRGAWETAADLMEKAARLTPTDQPLDAGQRTISAAEHHVHAGDRARARALLEQLLQTPVDRHMRAEALRVLAEVSYNDDNFVQASRLLHEAVGIAGTERTIAEILLSLSYVDAQMWEQLWDFPGAAKYANRALTIAEDLGAPALIAEALGYQAMLGFLSGDGHDWGMVERAVSLEDRTRLVPIERRPATMRALLLLYCGRHAEARGALEDLCARARMRGDESDLAFALTWLSWLELRAGNLALAADLAVEATYLATLTGSRSMNAWALGQQAYVAAHRGDVDGTRDCCAQTQELLASSGYLQPGIWIAASTTLLELSEENFDAAWRASEPLVRILENLDRWEPIIAFLLPDALEALIALGGQERAAPLVETLEQRGHELDRPWAVLTGARCRALLLASRGDIEAARTAIGQAVDAQSAVDMPFERGRTLLVEGMIQRRARRHGQAQTSLRQAEATFTGLGSARWAARSRRELQRVGLHRVNAGQLTEGEHRVAQLAAQGASNKEIAAALFISHKTVEANMARIYRKLGIHSRAELGARMSQSSH